MYLSTQRKKLVIVTGMHRSGTSALAKVFVDLGFDAGQNLISPGFDNPEGFWEDSSIFNLNNQILNHLFLSWDKIEEFEARRIKTFSNELLNHYLPVATQIIENKFNENSSIIIKDPRITILLPFWNKVFGLSQAEIIQFHIIRNPLSVAKSLEKRNGIPINSGLILWYYYNAVFLSDLSRKCNFISYHELLAQTKNTVNFIKYASGIDHITDESNPSVNQSLNHYPECENIADHQLNFYPETKKLWDLMKGLINKNDVSLKLPDFKKLMIGGLSNYLLSSEANKITATVVLLAESGDSSKSIIYSANFRKNNTILFEFTEGSVSATGFYLYLNDKPCLIKFESALISMNHETVKQKPESGNFLFVYDKTYYFDTNMPFFKFEFSTASSISSIEIMPEINEIDKNAAELIIAALKNTKSVLVDQNEEIAKQNRALHNELIQLKQQSDFEQQKKQEQILKQKIEIEALEKKSLWLYTEFNKVKNSISWKITVPLRFIQFLTYKIENKLYILINDIGASYRLMRREGLLMFFFRLQWYLRGKRLKEEIEYGIRSAPKSVRKSDKQYSPSEVLIFQRPVKPTVSIIVPVFNYFEMTYHCLQSVLRNSFDVIYELILIDDHSTDIAFNPEEMFVGATIIRNRKNLGFLKSCNKAAIEAQGEFLCFLNNDTEVHPEWLLHLVNLMESNKDIAIAGPKLIYPDGRLQEAGGIIWNDASAWNFGKFDDAEKPDYNYLKEVDYISGACLLVRKNVWDQTGGFDEQFAPAYYEDTDLAMQVKKLGLKIYYQPLSVVTHHEGISNGIEESSGIKNYQLINQQKFFTKWEYELRINCSPNGSNVFFHRDCSLHHKHLLVIDHYVPMYDQDAGSRSTFGYLNLFVKMGYKIHFIGDNYFKHEPYTTTLQQMGIEVLYGNYYQKNIRDWFRNNGHFIDFVIAHRVHIAPKYFEMIRKFTSAKIAYIGHDLQYLGSKRKFEVTGDKKFKKESAKFLKTETEIFNTVDIILPFSTYEEPYIKKLAPQKPVQVIPVYFFKNIPEKVPGFDERRDILFVGCFSHPPNPDAILWFVKEIFPKVQQRLPDVKIHLVGSQPTDEVVALQNDSVNVTGYVSDEKLIGYYLKSKLAILPLRFGAGVKGKLLESLYHQIPTVITTVASEGVPEIENYSLIADTPGDFAMKIGLLYQDKTVWQKFSAGGRDLIEKYYTEEAAKKLLEDILPFRDNFKLEQS